MSLLYVLLICGVVGAAVGQKCQTCMDNGAYCVDKEKYYICADGKNPETSMDFSCDAGQVCTDHTDICVATTELTVKDATSVCNAVDSCGACATGERFACVSRTQYALCPDKKNILSCPDGEVCRIDSYDGKKVICVPQCLMDFYGYAATCTSTTPITTTTAAPPTTTPTSPAKLIQICNDKKPTPTPAYFYVPNCTDLTCTRYIYCEQVGTSYTAIPLACTNGFYDKSTGTCVTAKPDNCDASCVV